MAMKLESYCEYLFSVPLLVIIELDKYKLRVCPILPWFEEQQTQSNFFFLILRCSYDSILVLGFQVGVPGILLRCLEHLDLKDVARPVAFLAKMTGYRPLAVQLLGKGLLDPGLVRKLIGASCPREVTLDVLMIVSDLARMDKVNVRFIVKSLKPDSLK